MRLLSRTLVMIFLGVAATSFAVPPLPIADDAALGRLGAELERLRGRAGNDGLSGGIDRSVGKDSALGQGAGNIGSAGSVSSSIGDGINAAFTFRDLLEKSAAASSLLDQAIDGTLEPDLDGYTRSQPDTPNSLCTKRNTDGAECGKCFMAAGDTLTTARYNLEKLRVSGLATKEYVSAKIAVGDGLSGLTGLAALEWQKQRSGINKQFDKYKITYDGKYEEMMRGLQTAMTRYDSCESQFGERDWYNRFGFLYVQFMADKYKRNF